MEDVLRKQLARGNVLLETAPPILRHMLVNGDDALFSDEVVASVRGSLTHIARQMLYSVAEQADIADRGGFAAERQDAVAQTVLNDTSFLAHAHARTLEARITERLRDRSNIDPVLSPLLQELAASTDTSTAATAIKALSAQARFVQQSRRMELPLSELPPDLLQAALGVLEKHLEDMKQAASSASEQILKARSQSQSRVMLLEELVTGLGSKARRALAVDNGGVAIFVTALAMAAEQPRDTAILSLGENQRTRLALALQAARVDRAAIEEQFQYFHPEGALPDGIETLSADRAAAMLAASSDERAR